MEVYFKLLMFLIDSHELRMINYIIQQKLLQQLYTILNPQNKIMMLNFVKFFTALMICRQHRKESITIQKYVCE